MQSSAEKKAPADTRPEERADSDVMPRVLVLTPDLSYKGGVTNYYRCLMLNEHPGIDYMSVNTPATDPELNPGVNRKIIFLKKIWYLPLIYLRFLSRARRYDIIHVNPSLNPKSFFRDAGFILLARLLRKKILVFIRGWEDEFEQTIKRSRVLSLLFRSTYARADSYIVLGRVFKEKIVGLGVDPGKKIYLETTIADSRYMESFNLDQKIGSFDREVNFLFISRILESKGVYIAMDACAICNTRWPDRRVTLYIAGDGDELESARQYAQAKAYSNIEFLGYISDQAKSDALRKCHIMIFPTFYGEGLPNSVLEGMLYGMPIISRPVGGISDVVAHGTNGYLSESLDTSDFADICSRFLENRSLYERMARTNHEKGNELFVIDAVRHRLLSIYKMLSHE